MKLKSLWILAVMAAALASCKRLDKLVSFNLDTKDPVVWLKAPDSLLTDTFPANHFLTFVSDDFSFNNYEKFATNKTTSGLVEDVEAVNITIQIDSGAVDFSFAKGLKVYLSSPSNLFNDAELFAEDDPEPGVDYLQFTMKPTNDEFLTLIQKDKYRFRTDFELYTPMPDTVFLSYKMSFRLKAQPSDD